MVALERINVCETVGRKNNCKLNFFSIYLFEKTKKYIFCLLKIADTSFRNTCFSEHLWWLLLSDVAKLKEKKNRTPAI